jgi:ArsR family transcriptional regulator
MRRWTCSTRPARGSTGRTANVEFRKGELESLPIRDGELDVAVLSAGAALFTGAAEALSERHGRFRPGGRVLVVDMLPHEREEYQQQMGHVWLGFSDKQMTRFLTSAGFTDVRVRNLPASPDVGGRRCFRRSRSRVSEVNRGEEAWQLQRAKCTRTT